MTDEKKPRKQRGRKSVVIQRYDESGENRWIDTEIMDSTQNAVAWCEAQGGEGETYRIATIHREAKIESATTVKRRLV
jgi:hypothetical protein